MNEPEVAVITLDGLWSRLEAGDDDGLLQLNAEKDCTPDFAAEMLALVYVTKAIAIRCSSSNRGSHSPHVSFKSGLVNDASFKLSSGLPEIPLRSFDCDFNY